MKKLILPIALAMVFFSCKNAEEKGKFTVNGEMKNIADQKVYLEELFFGAKDPEVLDTADVKNGMFSISAIAPEQGIYRLRFEKENTQQLIFINDQSTIRFIADGKDINGNTTSFLTSANASLKGFLLYLTEKRIEIERQAAKVGVDKAAADVGIKKQGEDIPSKNIDSIVVAESAQQDQLIDQTKQYVIKYVDTTANPVNALFALEYIGDTESLEKALANLTTRFPNHQALAIVVAQKKAKLAEIKEQQAAKGKFPTEGSMAPEITMNDVNDHPFSLSELRGKYVLVDFWASWCGPCRGENPNVVAAYNKFKNRNFTVLGVSLDADKAAWTQAIAKDKLTWKHISDLKEWGSAAVSLYGIEGIPYNVLVDPQGKIIATELRGPNLETTLESVLK